MTTITEAERNFINRSVSSLTELKAVSISPRRNGSVIKLEGVTNGVYAYNAASTATGNDLDVVVPGAITPPAPGRWLRSGIETSNDGTLASDSDNKLSTQKAIKTYVDAHPGTNVSAETEYWGKFYPGNTLFKSAITNGQTAFTLAQTPVAGEAFTLFLNGQERTRDTDYSFSGTALTWLDPVENGQTITLKSTDVLTARYNFLGSGANIQPNLWDYGVVFNAHWDGSKIISDGTQANAIIRLLDPTAPEPILVIGMSKSIPATTEITDADINRTFTITKGGVASPRYGVVSPPVDLTNLTVVSINRVGTTATATLSANIDILKVVGDFVAFELTGQPAYDGTQTITAIPASNQIEFTVAGTPPNVTTGIMRLEYSPQPWHNTHTFSTVSEHDFYIRDNVSLAHGYYIDLRKGDFVDDVRIMPTGTVSIEGRLESGTAKTWTTGSAKFPILTRFEPIRLYKYATNVWWFEFGRVSEEP